MSIVPIRQNQLLHPNGPQKAPVSAQDLTPEKKKELEKLNSACKDFESIFMLQLMKEMKKTVHKTNLVGGGFAEDIFSDMLDQERSK